MIIRRAQQSDIEPLVAIWRQFHDFHAAREPHLAACPGAEQSYAEFIAGSLASEQALVLLAEQEAGVIGYCHAMIRMRPPVVADRRFGQILDLAVLEGWRRRGTGQKLVEQTMEWFKIQGTKRVEVCAMLSNEISVNFWRKAGFGDYVLTLCKETGD